MKTVFAIFLVSLSTAQAQAAAALTRHEPLWDSKNELSLDGNWKLAERVCGVGLNSPLKRVEPTDGFRAESMDIRLNIQLGIRLAVGGAVEYFDGVWLAAINTEEHEIESVRPPMKHRLIYRIEDDGSLTFMLDGKGRCGTDVGQPAALFVNFVRESGN